MKFLKIRPQLKYQITLAAIILSLTPTLQSEVQPKMQQLYKLTDKIHIYVFDKNEFLKKSNSAEIEKTLADFKIAVANLKKEKATEEDDMKFRVRQLEEGLNEAEQAFKENSKQYSYWALRSTLSNCYNCHTQKALSTTHYSSSSLKSKWTPSFQQAEFLFLVRNYDEAIPLYEKIVKEYPKKTSGEQLEAALQKLLFYSVRVRKNDSETLAMIERLLLNLSLPVFDKSSVMGWKKYLNVKKYGLAETTKLETAESIESYVASRNNLAGNYKFANQRYIIDLETTQALFELLESSKNESLRPWLLYWLAYQERDYRQSMFDMSSEYYLKECVERYSKYPAARKCLALYKEMQTDSFTGSRGTEIPESINKIIRSYENLVNGKKN